MRKNLLTALFVSALLLALLSGCGSKEEAHEVISNQSTPVEGTANVEQDEELTPEEIQKKEDFANSDAKNDTDIGLKSIKIDTAEMTLSEEQKMIIQYFDDDYLEVEEYEFLHRYPNLFTGVQVRVYGEVAKIIEMEAETYQFVCSDWNGGYSMAVTCETSGTRFIEGDYLSIYGRYLGEQQFEIDGSTYILPVIEAYSKTSIYEMGVVYDFNLYSLDYIKTIAKAIFGDDIEVRKPVVGDEGFPEGVNPDALDWSYVVELENQSNAKFSKYLFSREIGYIEDMRATDNIRRNIEFSADFQHFFLFTYDKSLETLTLEYYDSNLNKIWKREFSETVNAVYDYTKNNVYVIANNELYTIDLTTGEDTFSPVYVGGRYSVRKISDGILLISHQKSDAVAKIDLQGNMVWKTNLSADIGSCTIQVVDGKIILNAYLDDDSYLPHYIVLDSQDGSVLADAISMSQ